MGPNAVAYLPRQVQVLELVEDTHALSRVMPAVWWKVGRKRVLAGMAEGRVPDIVAQRDRLCQRFVEAQRRGDRARDLRHLDGVRQACHEMIALRVHEDLGLVL